MLNIKRANIIYVLVKKIGGSEEPLHSQRSTVNNSYREAISAVKKGIKNRADDRLITEMVH